MISNLLLLIYYNKSNNVNVIPFRISNKKKDNNHQFSTDEFEAKLN